MMTTLMLGNKLTNTIIRHGERSEAIQGFCDFKSYGLPRPPDQVRGPRKERIGQWFPGTCQWITTAFSLTAMVLGMALAPATANAASEPAELAIDGYDPVAYFTQLQAVKGSPEITHEWLGTTWLFINEENKKLFVADSMRYMPNYGGYCSYDPMNLGHDHEVDPTAWRIVNDKLYLFYSERTAGQKLPADEWEQVKAGLSQ